MPDPLRSIRSIRRILLLAVVVGGLACGAEPTGPSVSDLRILPSSARLFVGNALTLDVTIHGSGDAGSVSWSSSDPGVATVSSRGVVEAVRAGTAQIEASVLGVSSSARVDVPEPAGTVDSDGGVLDAAAGAVQLSVPQGALGQETPISVEAASSDSLPATTGGARRIPGTAFEFGPRGIRFGAPAEMSIRYDPARIPRGVEEENLRLHRARNGGWEVVTAGSVDMAGDRVRGRVDGFSIYAVLDVPHGVPAAQITSPADGASFVQGTVISFQGSASDPADGDLTGSSLTWSSSEDGFLGNGTAFISGSLSVGSHEITLTATDSQGASATDSVTVVIVPPNQGPSVSIASPSDGSIFIEGATITFDGSASDNEDGDLSEEIVWSSSVDGELGIGASLSRVLTSGRTHRISAQVTDSDGVTSSTSVLMTVDDGPELTISEPADGSTFEEADPVTFSASASDTEDGDLSSTIDWISSQDGELGSGASISTTGLSVGSHTITAAVSDARGQVATDQIALTVNPNGAPVVTITQPAGGQSFNEGASISFVGSAVDEEDGDLTSQISWESSVDGPLGTGGSVTATLSAGVAHTVTASVMDSNGVAGSASVTVRVNARPALSIVSPSDGSTYEEGATITFDGTATDTEEGDLSSSIQWSSDLSGAIGEGASVSTSALLVGTHVVSASVSDSGGLAATAQITIQIDANAVPTVTITSPASGTTFDEGTPIGFTGMSTDEEDGALSSDISWSSDIDGALGTGASLSSTLSAGTTHTVTASVTDSRGAEGTASVTVTVDAVPTVTITSPGAPTTVEEGDPVTLEATASDVEDGALSSSIAWSSSMDGALGTGASLVASSLSVGAHTITATVTDGRGQASSDQVTVNVDPNGAPSVTITEPATGSLFQEGESIAFTGSATDEEDGDVSTSLSWSSSRDGIIGTGASFSVPALSVGEHTITATATDSNGTAGTASVTVTVNGAPTVTITDPATDPSTFEEGVAVTFTGTASDSEDGDLTASIAWTSDLDGTIGTGGSFSTSALSVGTHAITASVTDGDGAGATDQITVIIDPNAVPSVTITAPADGSTHEELVAVTFTAAATDEEDGDLSSAISWTSSLDGQFGTGASISFSGLSVGSHTITASVSDAGGETGSDQISITIDPNTPASLEFVVQPSTTAAGSTISPAVVVEVHDVNGEPVTVDPSGGQTETITLSFTSGTNDEGAVLVGTLSQPVDWTSATATFDDLSIATIGSYSFDATPSGRSFNPPSATSASFVVEPGEASATNSTITASPTSMTTDGSSTITVQLIDGSGNLLTTGGDAVTLSTDLGSLTAVTDNGDGTYSATLTSTSTGTATITGTVNTEAIIDQATVDVTVGAAAQLAITTQPSASAGSGEAFAEQPVVQLQDASGNPVSQSGVSVAAAIATGGGTLGGTTPVTTDASGVATFTDLSITGTTGDRTLEFTSGTLTAATSNVISITPGEPSAANSTITADPISISADGVSTSDITVQLIDASGNLLTGGGDTVTLSATLGTLSDVTDNGDGTYSATLTSGTTTGTSTITGTVNGDAMTNTAEVTLT